MIVESNRSNRFHRSHRSYPRGAKIAIHCSALLLLALVIYVPWARAPFPLIDYSEFLRPLREGRTFTAGLDRVVDYYHSHGRSSYLAYIQLAFNWLLFRDRPVAWNLAVFAYAAGAVAAVWVLLVKLGNRPLAATLASALLIVATPAVPAWLRPTGEPLALMFLAIAFVMAFSYQRATRWVPRALSMLALLLGICLAKDLLAPLILLPVIVACCWDDGFRVPSVSPRSVGLVAGATVVAAGSALMIWHAMSQRAAGAYTEGYGLTNVSPPEVIGIFWRILLPRTRSFETQALDAGHIMANALFSAVFIAGWGIALRARAKRTALQQLNVWLALILSGALIYAPLRWFSSFYALPFFLGSVALFAHALSQLETRGALTKWAARSCALIMLLVCGVFAFNTAREETANRRLHGTLSESLRALEPVDSIVVEWPVVNEWVWAQRSVVIRRRAIDSGDLREPAPPARDVLCGTTARARTDARVLVINYPDLCGELQFRTNELTQRYWALVPVPVQRSLRLQMAVIGSNARRSRMQ